MDLNSIIKAIAEYGLSFVISGVFLYIVIRFVNIGFKKLEDVMKTKKHDKLLEKRSEIDVEVYDLINEFITSHRGTRVQVIEFTNSVTSVAYLPFKYMSCTYEVVSYGVKPEAKRIDKLSTSLFTPLLSKMSKEGIVLLDDCVAHTLSGAVHDVFHSMGDTYQLCHILRSQKTKAIGFVSLSKSSEVTDADTQDIKVLASQLSALLGVLDK